MSSSTTAPLLLTPKDLSGSQERTRVFLDASWHMPNSPRKARDEYLKRRLPGARFLDLDEVASEHELGLKHMMPSGETFARVCGEYHNQAEVYAF
jgi:thiosulfate/3-mercaptopyruvate sulfurtransferase